MNLARSGLHPDQGTSAIEIALDVMVIERALHQHFVIRGYRPRAGGSIEGERRIPGPDFDIARSGLEGPRRRRRARSLDVPRAGLRMKTSVDVLDLDVARS